MKEQTQIKDFSQIVHLYWSEGILSKDEVISWMGEIDCELDELTDSKIVFGYFDSFEMVKMTVYQSGRVEVETDLDAIL